MIKTDVQLGHVEDSFKVHARPRGMTVARNLRVVFEVQSSQQSNDRDSLYLACVHRDGSDDFLTSRIPPMSSLYVFQYDMFVHT